MIKVCRCRCASYDKFFIEDLGKTYYYQDLGCLNEPIGKFDEEVSRGGSSSSSNKRKAIETSKICGPDDEGIIYKVEVSKKMVYEFCFDKDAGKSLWTRYNINHFSTPPKGTKRVKFIANGLDNAADVDFTTSYTQVFTFFIHLQLYFI